LFFPLGHLSRLLPLPIIMPDVLVRIFSRWEILKKGSCALFLSREEFRENLEED
jgi:hypothetical protein